MVLLGEPQESQGQSSKLGLGLRNTKMGPINQNMVLSFHQLLEMIQKIKNK